MKKTPPLYLLISCLPAVVLSGCGGGSVTERVTRHEKAAIELDKSEMARVKIEMGGGELRVVSGTPKLLEADFAFTDPDARPLVDYRSTPSGGELTISQPSSFSSIGNSVYEWDLKLNDQLPLDIITSLGGGKVSLTLGRMNLRGVDVNMGAGEMKMDLRGEPKRSYEVHVRGGVGEATVYLPKDVGISATAVGAIGSINVTGLEKRDGVWVNPERLDAPVTVRVDVKGGIGEIKLVR
jgi:hypothetical protein